MLVSDPRVGGVVNVLEARASAKGQVDKLEEWDNRNLVEFSEVKGQVLN